MSGNQIAGCADNEGLENLEVLDVSYNNLDNVATILPCLDRLSSLKSLYLTNNRFNATSFHAFETLSSKLLNLEVLDISGNDLTNDILPSLGVFTSLKELYLAYIQLDSSLHIQGLCSMLKNLEVLDLSENKFNDSDIAFAISGLSSLKSLNLRSCQLTPRSFFSMPKLRSLEILDLARNHLNESILWRQENDGFTWPINLQVLGVSFNKFKSNKILSSLSGIQHLKSLDLRRNLFEESLDINDFCDLSNLEHLALDHNFLGNEFLKSIGELTSLKVLSLSSCGINGTLPSADWSKLKKLEELDISYNQYEGLLPSSFVNMTSLRKLELSYNHFIGNFDSNLASFTCLEYLGFIENQFEVPISFTPFANHSKLKFIYGEGNQVVLDSQPTLQTWIPKFQLQALSLSSATKINSLLLPNFLLYQNKLTSLDYTSYMLEGEFPNWLLENNTQMTEILVRNCSFTGTFQLPSHPLLKIRMIDVSDNSITGQIPNSNISSIFPSLQFLNMSRNDIQGSIPREFSQMNLMDTLDLSENHLLSEIPKNISGDRSLLKFLKLSDNDLHGPVFPTLSMLKNLEELHLDGNSLSGSIPNSFSTTSLMAMDLSNNHLVGKLPSVVGNLSNLKALSLSNNCVEGCISTKFMELKSLDYLDVSQNYFTGFVPSFANSSVSFIHLGNNRLSGLSKEMFNGNSSLLMLDLSYNEISNSIQEMILQLENSGLNILILKGNHFTGYIPQQLCQLINLRILDLSYNNFFGGIPNCLGKMPFESLKATFHGFIQGDHINAVVLKPNINEKVNFTIKERSYTCTGSILDFMSRIDLSYNKLNRSIPSELGNLTRIRALNLSHNEFTGQIPATFSNLAQTESLDLSFNKLSGQIPPQLSRLTFLEVFSVAHNNLSGETPERKDQFITFVESSYEGNPLLCGPPLPKSCNPYGQSHAISPNSSYTDGDNDNLVDMFVFCISFGVSYISVLLVIAATLYINPYWRQAWFYYIELVSTNCYYFIQDNLRRFSNFRNM